MPRTPPRPTGARPPPAQRDHRADDSSATTPVPHLARGTEDVAVEAARARRQQQEGVTLVAHDLRTPLAVIMLEAELGQHRISADEMPELARSLERIARNAAYIDRLVGDMLDAGADDAGRLDLRLQRLDLVQLIVQTLERAVSTVDRERIHVQLRGPALVNGDPTRLERVIANLLSNAFKYSPEGASVKLGLDVGKGRAQVSIEDHGIGMTPTQARSVFDRYRRNKSTRDREGYGLGLYISRRIIVAHGGRIGVVSAPGGGSRFFFELPTIT